MDIWAAKTTNNTGYSQPRYLPVPEATIQAFRIIHVTISLK